MFKGRNVIVIPSVTDIDVDVDGKGDSSDDPTSSILMSVPQSTLWNLFPLEAKDSLTRSLLMLMLSI